MSVTVPAVMDFLVCTAHVTDLTQEMYIFYPKSLAELTCRWLTGFCSSLQFIKATLWIFISSACWLSSFFNDCRVLPCVLFASPSLLCASPHKPDNFKWSFNASESPLNSCKCDSNPLFCEKQKPSSSLIHCRKQHNPEFWCELSLIIWSRGSNTTDSVVCFPPFFSVFAALGSASFSLDTHYKVNSNCTLGDSAEIRGCPQAKALSHTL